jgi:hypothetical protein
MAAGCVSGFKRAIASRFDRSGASSDASGIDGWIAEGSTITEGVMVD